MLREFAPQFAERSRQGQYAQQDAQEAWGAIITAMKNKLKIGSGTEANSKFVEKFMTGEMTKT